ncbi:transcriptional regulator, XRE family with cupin sensor [Humidesulfovibrio mexicanus]|uniref:Transcriptional regulator, XRE family with cupin sensor n=2 Tax=Humidesulfovibrio mexicanus TaxID=147047 RepID=A0A239BT57_9BACT|nr:XRE family transcriptional regulator [Humidesulfovibrio mexicanus]SNS10832.1 transcriptional regulator, XRE family with cupin sensor [Humidesulfovibrio mexicanus]
MHMEQAHKDIAPRLRGLRDALDMSVEDLAAKTGVTPEQAALYEAGETEIPVGFLMKVAQACHVDLTVLISGVEPHLKGYSLVRHGEGLSVERRKDYDYKSLAYRFSGRKMEPFLITVPPKKPEDMNLVVHSGQEFIHVLEGRLELRLGEDVLALDPGDSLYFDSQTPHALRGLDDKQAVFLDVIL